MAPSYGKNSTLSESTNVFQILVALVANINIS